MSYNLTLVTQSANFVDFITVINNATEQVLFSGLMIGIFLIMILGLKRYAIEQAVAAASWSCFLLSSFLSYAGLASFLFPLGFGIISALSALYLYKAR